VGAFYFFGSLNKTQRRENLLEIVIIKEEEGAARDYGRRNVVSHIGIFATFRWLFADCPQ
jgi:hypothetical protein